VDLGGRPASSIRSIRDRFRTVTATALVTCEGSPNVCRTWRSSASTRFGCLRSSRRQWQISVMTSRTIPTLTHCSGAWTTSTRCSQPADSITITPFSPPNRISTGATRLSGLPSIPLYTADRPEVHDVIAEMRRVADEFPNRVLIGEIYLPLERLVAYYGRDLAGMHLPFNFSLLSTSWHAPSIARLIAEYEAALPAGGWPNWVLGNHDRPRIASRVGPDQARIAAMLLLTLRGTPTVYYGDEIAMKEVAIAPAHVRDPLGKTVPGRGLGRDGCRTPMQWDSTTQAGFSSVQPWLPLGSALDQDNVLAQRSDNTSVYWLYRRLIDLRRKRPALSLGSYGSVRADGNLLVFTREHEREQLLVALNFASEPVAASLSSGEWIGRLLVSSAGDRADEPVRGSLNLRAHEGAIVELCDSAG
jgi:alpha-glucosidase